MYTTVRDALDAFLRYVGESGDPVARQTALDCLNLAYQEISTAHQWRDQESPAPLRLTLTVGRSRYSLPAHVAYIRGEVRNMTRPGGCVTEMDSATSGELFPKSGTVDAERGPVAHYRLIGITGVRQHPRPTGEALEVVSDDATDTTVTVTVSGDDVFGEKRERGVTLTGTAPVAVGTWTYIDTFAKAFADTVTPSAGLSSAGSVTLRVVSTGTVLQVLDSQEASREHKVLQFYPAPDAADEIAIPFIQRPRLLVQGSDPLPGDWWPALKEGMEIQFRRNTGELSIKDNPPRPALLRLVEADNMLGGRPRTRPFTL